MRFWIAVIPLVLFAALAGVLSDQYRQRYICCAVRSVLDKPAPDISNCPRCPDENGDYRVPIFQKARYRF